VFQGSRVVSGEFRALLGLALLSFAQGKTDDASVYSTTRARTRERMRDPSCLRDRFESAMVHWSRAVSRPLGLARSRVALGRGRVRARVGGPRPIHEGEVAFELGNYRNAELLFQRLRPWRP
jgi:hypothetical protein